MYTLLDSVTSLRILSYQIHDKSTRVDTQCLAVLPYYYWQRKLGKDKVYADKCQIIAEETEPPPGQVNGGKTKAYQIRDLNKQPKVSTLFLKAKIKCYHLKEAFLDTPMSICEHMWSHYVHLCEATPYMIPYQKPNISAFLTPSFNY